MEEELPKLWCLITVDGANELVDSGERMGGRGEEREGEGGMRRERGKGWMGSGRGGGRKREEGEGERTHLLGVVTMMKHLLLEEGKGSRYKPVMGSTCSETSNN